ncbi:protein shisa-like-2A [Paramisgurnus dabryanus]|uniref:protein shisa-like-2A n=1 Tax=Paramisgurnus dabryanus TaxID=90735 RepID=UPI0031F359C8
MSAMCTSYQNADKGFVKGFSCPNPDTDIRAAFCCGFSDVKYCCDDPNSFFPYEYGYMWWLSVGALVGLSIAAVVLMVFLITVCVLCYLFIATKPSQRDNGLTLSMPGLEATSEPSRSSGPRGFCKHFFNHRLDCEKRPADPERLFQRCFTATVTKVNVEEST